MTALSLFMHWLGDDVVMPADLRARLKAFVAVPAPNTLSPASSEPFREIKE